MLRKSLVFFFCCWVVVLSAQEKFTFIVKASDSSPIVNALISLESKDGKSRISSFTDNDGVTNVFIKPGAYSLLIDGGFNYEKYTSIIEPNFNTKIYSFTLKDNLFELPQISVESDRMPYLAPLAMTTIGEEKLESLADGRELPQLLQGTPSLIAHSDAGNGVGYSYLRIRGSDQSRINVTINGIPLNDSESHQVFWVDLPDFGSSLGSIQIQRGVGTSSFGSGAFGANIKLNTTKKQGDFVKFKANVASYNTQRYSVELQQKGLTIRLSNISSDGYIDRAKSDLQSYFIQYEKKIGKHNIKMFHSYGSERTYQSWNGAPEALVLGDKEGLEAHILRSSYSDSEVENIRRSDRRYNAYTYNDQVDDYAQSHNQIHWNSTLKDARWSLASAVHYTHGEGFFEEFRGGEKASDYGVNPLVVANDTIAGGDIVRRRWLDNDFYGMTFSALYQVKRFNVKWAANASRYDGKHFGRLIKGDFVPSTEEVEYYSSDSKKDELSSYVQLNYLYNNWLGFIDLQYRMINYTTKGNDNDLKEFDIDQGFSFFNPKLGIQHTYGAWRSFVSFSVANREPVRNDFIDQENALPETLYDWELGVERISILGTFGLNLFYMDYSDQLVPTGELNDVGALVRKNIADSYRMGIELSAQKKFGDKLVLSGNLSLINSVIKDWKEPLVDFVLATTTYNEYDESAMALSPNVTANLSLAYGFLPQLSLSIDNQYVGAQFLDNTESEDKKIDGYFVQNAHLLWNGKIKEVGITLKLSCYNLLAAEYSSFGYTYSYALDREVVRENFLYPQALRNFNLGLMIEL